MKFPENRLCPYVTDAFHGLALLAFSVCIYSPYINGHWSRNTAIIFDVFPNPASTIASNCVRGTCFYASLWGKIHSRCTTKTWALHPEMVGAGCLDHLWSNMPFATCHVTNFSLAMPYWRASHSAFPWQPTRRKWLELEFLTWVTCCCVEIA